MLKNLLLILLLLAFSGCATAPVMETRKTAAISPGVPGFYHRVERGQTLWRISKMYNVELDDIVGINHISDVTSIELGQLIFIPKKQKFMAAPVQPVLEDFIWPVKGKIISSFGQMANNMVNKGLNIKPYSQTEVVASRGGRVVFLSQKFKGYGKTVIIEHGDGFSTIYSGNAMISAGLGEDIPRGRVIAKLDPSGYLHFEIRKGHNPQNPVFYLQ